MTEIQKGNQNLKICLLDFEWCIFISFVLEERNSLKLVTI